MNTIRSPAPGGVFFNVPTNLKKNSAVNAVVGAANTAANTAYNAMNTMKNTMANVVPANAKTPMPTKYILLGVIMVVIVILFGTFWRQIQQGLGYTYDQIRALFGAQKQPPPSEEPQGPPVLEKPEAPQNDTVKEQKLVEKILPGRQQVFNVSKNSYTYYDAEPLCKALGAELATYEQVKQAYEQGADWCNYGWVKGQWQSIPHKRVHGSSYKRVQKISVMHVVVQESTVAPLIILNCGLVSIAMV